VNLPADLLEQFIPAWRARTGTTATVLMQSRLYRLQSLVPPASAAGRARPGGPGDRALLIGWVRDFLATIGEPSHDVEGVVDDALASGVVTIGEDAGVPSSMVLRTLPESGVARIRYVFTPATLRGRGYAGTATAAACTEALRDGADEVVLFTDLANPTSNALYQRLGFRPVEDRTVVQFA
jgi:predicted GNAT family acetyltransferase